MKSLLLAVTVIAALFCPVVTVMEFKLQASHWPTINYTMGAWAASIQAVATILAIIFVSGYFNNDIWKSKTELDKERIKYYKESERLGKWLKVIATHEAIKMLKEAGIKEEDTDESTK